MDKEKLLKEKKLIKNMLIITFFIILFASLESFIMAKSKELYEAYIQLNKDKTFDDYLSLIMINYFATIIEPVIISLFTFFTYKKYGISSLYKIIFSILMALRIFNFTLKFQTQSIFYYAIITLYIIFLILIITAPITKRKVKNAIF